MTITYLWVPEVSDNVAPGLDPLITYNQNKNATLPWLQNVITNMNSDIQTEINNLDIPNQGKSYVNKELYCHNNYTEYKSQRRNIIHTYDNRRSSITQQN